MLTSSIVRIIIYLAVAWGCYVTNNWIDSWTYNGAMNLLSGSLRVPLSQMFGDLPARYLPAIFWVAGAIAEAIGGLFPVIAPKVRRRWLWAAIFALLGALVFWEFRVTHWYADLQSIDQRTEPMRLQIETASPFGGFSSIYTYWAARAMDIRPSLLIAVISVLFGATAVAALFAWSIAITPAWPWPFAIMLSTGFVVLFFGYVEKATPKLMAMECWYLLVTTLTLQKRRVFTDALSSACLSAMILMHGSALCWLPAHVLFVWGRRGWRERIIGVIAFLIPCALFVLLVWVQHPYWDDHWGNVSSSRQWLKEYCVTNCEYKFWTVGHFGDILVCLAALAPVATLAIWEAMIRARGSVEQWLALSSLGWLFLSVCWFPVFGYLADWDLFASTPLVISACVIVVAARVMPAKRFQRFAMGWVACGALHTLAFWRIFQP